MTHSQDASASKLAARLAKSVSQKGAALKSGKAGRAADCQALEQIPNIGQSLAEDLRQIGIHHPRDLISKDAFVLYQQLCAATGQRHDPCVLDTFMAATDFMRGAPAAPWWQYTAHRKALYGQIAGTSGPTSTIDTSTVDGHTVDATVPARPPLNKASPP